MEVLRPYTRTDIYNENKNNPFPHARLQNSKLRYWNTSTLWTDILPFRSNLPDVFNNWLNFYTFSCFELLLFSFQRGKLGILFSDWLTRKISITATQCISGIKRLKTTKVRTFPFLLSFILFCCKELLKMTECNRPFDWFFFFALNDFYANRIWLWYFIKFVTCIQTCTKILISLHTHLK